MIKSYQQFILEREEKPDSLGEDAKISNLFQEIDRNYNNYPSIATAHLSDILILQEIRGWKDFANRAELNKVITDPAKFYLEFEKGPENCKVQVNFDISFKGVENFDIPDPDYNYQRLDDRMGISLESLNLKRIKVKTDSIAFDSSNFSKDLGKTVLRFLLNVFKPQFDMIGDEALIIRQL